MAYRSWLKDVRVVQDLGPHLNSLTFRKAEDAERDARYEQKWRELGKKPLPVAPEFVRFFGSMMHDSGVISIARLHDELRVTVDNMEAGDFSCVASRRLGIEQQPWLYPVELVCHEVAYVNAVHEIPGGGLRWTDWGMVAPDGEFLYDWFFEQDGRLQWIAQIHHAGRSVYLLVDCARVSAVDRRRDALVRAYGIRVGEWWDLVLEESRYQDMSRHDLLDAFLAGLG